MAARTGRQARIQQARRLSRQHREALGRLQRVRTEFQDGRLTQAEFSSAEENAELIGQLVEIARA